MKQSNFEHWLKTLNDSAILRLWVYYCSPSEGDDLDAEKAYSVHEEAMTRNLLPSELYDFDA